MVTPPAETEGVQESVRPPLILTRDVSMGTLGTDRGIAFFGLLSGLALIAFTAAISIVYPIPLTSGPPVERAPIDAVVPDVPNVT